MKIPIEIRAYTDYSPIKIFSCLEGNPDEVAQKAGLSGNFIVVPNAPASFPASREFRDAWVVSGGKIVEDPTKKAEIVSRRQLAAAETDSILGKLGVSKDELKKVVG